MNWLLRTVTNATCIHDLLWFFVSALSPQYEELEDAGPDEVKDAAPGAQKNEPPGAQPAPPVVAVPAKVKNEAKKEQEVGVNNFYFQIKNRFIVMQVWS